MGDLLAADPLEIASLGLRLLRAASAVGDVRPVEVPSSWRGRTAEVVGGRLCAVAGALPRIEQAYDDSGRALLLHARAVEDARVLARRAADLRAEADRMSALSTLSGPDPGDALRMTAARWEAQAAEMHDAAVRRCVAVLDEVAASAPPVRRGVAGERFRADAAGSVWGELSGLAFSAVTAGEALGGNRAARDELVSVAKESWRVWEPFVELYQQLDDDRGGLLVGGAIGLVGIKGLRLGDPSQAKASGFLKGIREGELTVDDLTDAWDQAHAEAALQDRVLRLRGVLLPSVEELVSGRVDLAHHEAHGGHTLSRHVGKSLAFLRARLRLERSTDGERSTFTDLATAERLVADALARNADAVRAFASGSGKPDLNVIARLQRSGAGTVLRADGSWGVPQLVHVLLRRDEHGNVRVHTAMLRETWHR
jgi:Bacterial CdiA-CT RNAse A domain